MSDFAITLENVSKVYPLYAKPIDRLKESLYFNKKKYHKPFHALNDITFEIKKGETIGILGKNGSGKSTLLKIITGILQPTSGKLFVKGRISALLELGAGFNFEYTGIENIYMNGTIMGYSKEEMDTRLEQILNFAEIGDFIYQPVKNYSSGMFARLAFAVAINVEPEILIVDEALSVGDIFFQNKCFKKFEELQKKGVTILLVSHDISSIKKYCDRALWISEGKQIDFGDKDDVCIRYYNNEIYERNLQIKINNSEILDSAYGQVVRGNTQKVFPRFTYEKEVGGTKEAKVLSFSIKDSLGQVTSLLQVDHTYTIHIVGEFHKNMENVLFGITLETLQGTMVYTANNYMGSYIAKNVTKGKIYESIFKVKLPKILRGRYLVSPAIASGTQTNHIIHSWYQNACEIFIENPGYNLALIELDTEWIINEYEPNEIVLEQTQSDMERKK